MTPSYHIMYVGISDVIVQVGSGIEDYEAALKFLAAWAHVQLGWVHVDSDTSTARGSPVFLQAKPVPLLPLWVGCPLRVAYRGEGTMPDDKSSMVASSALPGQEQGSTADVAELARQRQAHLQEEASKGVFGDSKDWNRARDNMPELRMFRCGITCCKGHYLQGEERFQVEHHASDDSVWCADCRLLPVAKHHTVPHQSLQVIKCKPFRRNIPRTHWLCCGTGFQDRLQQPAHA